MLGRLSRRRIAIYGGILVGGALAWLLLAPQQLGGSASYVVIDGGSMEPVLSDGDLAVVRRAGRYDAGDAVAYRSEKLRRVVLHRIVAADGNRYVLRGDANDWTDSSRPIRSEILGVLWFSIPGAGSAVSWLGEPRNAAVVTGFLVLAFLTAAAASVRRRRPRSRRAAHDRPTVSTSALGRPPENGVGVDALIQPALALTAFLLLAAVVLGLVSFSRTTTTETTRDVSYAHGGVFSYSSAVPAGPVYPDGRVDTGEPAFLRVVERVQTSFDYRFRSDGEHQVEGRAVLRAELSNESGWKRAIALTRPATFAGDGVRLAGTLDLRGLRQLVRRVEKATSVPYASYTLALVPEVQVTGRVAGATVEAVFAPRLRFTMDGLQLRLEELPADGSSASGLHPGRERSVRVPQVEPRELSLGPVEVEVATARRAAFATGGFGLVGMLLLAALGLTGRWTSEPARIRLAYGRLLVPLAEPPAGGPVVEIGSIRGLARLARSSDRPILVHEDGGTWSYFVDDGAALYRYRSRPARSAGEAPAAGALNDRESVAGLPSAPPAPRVTGGAVERS